MHRWEINDVDAVCEFENLKNTEKQLLLYNLSNLCNIFYSSFSCPIPYLRSTLLSIKYLDSCRYLKNGERHVPRVQLVYFIPGFFRIYKTKAYRNKKMFNDIYGTSQRKESRGTKCSLWNYRFGKLNYFIVKIGVSLNFGV